MYSYTLSLTIVLDGSGWLMPCPGCFNPRNDLIPTVQEVGWADWLVWSDAENLTTTGI